MTHHQQVVGNEQIGQSQPFLQVVKHVDNLCLNGHVQGRYRFVANNELRIHRQCPGNADTLPLTAGKLVGIPGSMFAVQAHKAHQLQNPILPLLLGLVQVMHVQRLTHNVRHCHAGV